MYHLQEKLVQVGHDLIRGRVANCEAQVHVLPSTHNRKWDSPTVLMVNHLNRRITSSGGVIVTDLHVLKIEDTAQLADYLSSSSYQLCR